MSHTRIYRIANSNAMVASDASEAPISISLYSSPAAESQALGIVRACCPTPHSVARGGTGQLEGAADVMLVWHSDDTIQLVERCSGLARNAGIPLIALVNHGPDEQAALLRAGADFVCGTQVQPALIRAMMHAYHRISGGTNPDTRESGIQRQPGSVLVAGPIRIDVRAHSCLVYGQPVQLTLKEFDLLVYLLRNVDNCCTRDELLEQVWGLDFDPGSNSVDVFVYTLRRKLKDCGLGGVIQTVRGVGYRLTIPLTND